MLTTIRYILLTALRDRLFVGMMLGVVFATYVASVLGSTAMVENQEMTVSLSAFSARLIVMVGMMVFVSFHLRHAFDTKEMDVLLSRPIGRCGLVLSYWLGFVAVALLIVLPVLGLMAWLSQTLGAGFVLWAVSMVLELCLVVAIALFTSFTLRSGVSAVLGSMGLYVLARMMGFFVATAGSQLLVTSDPVRIAMREVLKAISMVVPRLDLFGNSEWLVRGGDVALLWQLMLPQTAVMVALLLLATMWDLLRKQF